MPLTPWPHARTARLQLSSVTVTLVLGFSAWFILRGRMPAVLLTTLRCLGPAPGALPRAACLCQRPCPCAAAWASGMPGCPTTCGTSTARRCRPPRRRGGASCRHAATPSSPGSSACCWPRPAAWAVRPGPRHAASSARPWRTHAGAAWTGASCLSPVPRCPPKRTGTVCSLGRLQVTGRLLPSPPLLFALPGKLDRADSSLGQGLPAPC